MEYEVGILLERAANAPLVRLLIAGLLGALVGLEREGRAKPAGLRTVVLICLGAELFTEASLSAARVAPGSFTRSDPGRIAAQIVTGVGFLGAGTILVHRERIVGLTTAASIWLAAAIGMTVGLSRFALAFGGTALVLVTLAVIGRIELSALNNVAGVLSITVRDESSPWLGGRIDVPGLEGQLIEMTREDDATQVVYRFRGDQSGRDALKRQLFHDRHVLGFRFE